jgi:hypothetical protein
MKKIIPCLFLLSLLSGCASIYHDPKLAANSSLAPAILVHEHPLKSGVVLEQIDGKWRGIGVFAKYELSPGEHSLLLALNQAFWVGEKLIVRFPAKAGETYHLENSLDTKMKYWSAWVIESSTGKKFDAEVAKPWRHRRMND